VTLAATATKAGLRIPRAARSTWRALSSFPDKEVRQAAAVWPGEGALSMRSRLTKVVSWVALLSVAVLGAVVLLKPHVPLPPVDDITFTELLAQIDEGRVHDVTITGHVISGHYLSDNRSFETYAPDDPTLFERLANKNVEISVSPPPKDYSWLKRLFVFGLPSVGGSCLRGSSFGPDPRVRGGCLACAGSR